MEKLLIEEQEVNIGFTRADEYATMYTSDITWIRKLDKMCEKCPNDYECIKEFKTKDGVLVAKEYKFPKKLISLRKPNKKIELTEDEKNKRINNLKKNNN